MSQASTISAWSRDLRLAVVAIIAVATASAIGQLAHIQILLPGMRDATVGGASIPTRNFVHEIDDTRWTRGRTRMNAFANRRPHQPPAVATAPSRMPLRQSISAWFRTLTFEFLFAFHHRPRSLASPWSRKTIPCEDSVAALPGSSWRNADKSNVSRSTIWASSITRPLSRSRKSR